MARAAFVLAASFAIALASPLTIRAQVPAPQAAPASQTDPTNQSDEIGNVASVQGTANLTRNGASSALKVSDPIYKGDVLRTGPNASLGVTFDDETTFNLSANASITVDEFVYTPAGGANAALFNVTRGTVAFAANLVAKTGDMKITTPTSTLGIRGTSGVIEVPEGATPGSAGEVAVKLYADADGRVGRIELFDRGGSARLGQLTRATTGFALCPGAGGRFAAVALTIPPGQATRDRAFVQRTFAARNIGRRIINQRRLQRAPGLQRTPGLQRAPGSQRPGTRQPFRQPRQGLRNTPQLRRPNAR
ncbi:MAG: FecR family protein [Pseudolabrys sp.]